MQQAVSGMEHRDYVGWVFAVRNKEEYVKCAQTTTPVSVNKPTRHVRASVFMYIKEDYVYVMHSDQPKAF